MLAVLPAVGSSGVGCSVLFPPKEVDVVLTTDRAEYLVTQVSDDGVTGRYGFSIELQLENRGLVPVYLSRCGPESTSPLHGISLLENATGAAGHRSAYARGWVCPTLYEPFRVDPGETRIDTLHLRGPNRLDGHTGVPIGSLEGRMKVFYQVQDCPEPGACLPFKELGSSNPFRVVFAPEFQATRSLSVHTLSRSNFP